MRAPPESLRPMTGAPARMARSMILQIFRALVSDSEPPKTVKSCAKTYTRRPSMRPKPVTKPSPAGRWSCIPKSTQRCRTNLSSSSNVPSSRSRSIRSRAVSLPALCSRSRRSGPPPASASALRRRRSSMRSLCFAAAAEAEEFSLDKRRSGINFFFVMENADGEMGGEPSCAEEKDDAEDKFGTDGGSALGGRWDGGDVYGRADKGEHGGEGHRDDQCDGDDGGDDFFHGEETRRGAQGALQRIAQAGGRMNGGTIGRCFSEKGKADRDPVFAWASWGAACYAPTRWAIAI